VRKERASVSACRCPAKSTAVSLISAIDLNCSESGVRCGEAGR
jgi:hypothetical protein